MKKNIINRVNKFFQNIDLRKFFGTIVGGIFFLCCVAYFTYAYYEWKSDETSIALTIHEASVECTLGPDVIVSNIGPVLKISDGVKTSFGIENTFTEDMAVSVTLDITSISEELLDESFKWAIVEDQEGGENFDYENPIIEGSFKNFRVGNNLITTALPVITQNTTNYEFIVYIDGTIKNDISMMQNSMEASLSLGNCGEDYIPYDELTQFAFYSADDNSLTFTYDYPVAVGDVYQGKTVTNLYTGYDTTTYNSKSAVPWYSDGNYDDIISVTFLETTTPISTAYWFNGFKNVENMNLEKLDTSNVTTMSNMFNNCSSLESLNVDNFNTSNVTDMYCMFMNCNRLVELDLSSFNTSNVVKMNSTTINQAGMFHNCRSLTYLDINSFDTSNLKSFDSMFQGCANLIELDLSNFDTSNVNTMRSMFQGCANLIELDLSNFDTSNVTNMHYMFSNCSSLISLDLGNFNTSNVTVMSGMFTSCTSLISLDLSTWDVSNVTNFGVEESWQWGGMFVECTSLISLDLSNWDTSSAILMGQMFCGCKRLAELDLTHFNTSNVTSMTQMFNNCSGLVNLNISTWDTSNVTNMTDMFARCYNLISLNVSNFDTSNVTSMAQLFYRCSSLTELDLSNFDTSNVTRMEGMFTSCLELVNLNLGDFDTSNVVNMNQMFFNNRKLITSITIKNISSPTYNEIFSYAATAEGASITVYYVGDNPETTDVNESTYDLVEAMIATGTGNITNGGCKGDYCTIE